MEDKASSSKYNIENLKTTLKKDKDKGAKRREKIQESKNVERKMLRHTGDTNMQN